MRFPLAALALAAASIGWLDPHARARDASRLFAAGKYEDAAAKYNEALVDDPDSALLHFNLGDAQFKQGKYTDALNAFQQVPAEGDALTARVAYNLGNTKYRLGEAAAASDPKAALGLWAEALIAYRRAMGADPVDVDAKFNHEFVEQKIAELKKKLEEQQKAQEEKKQQEEQKPQDQQGDQQEQQQAQQEPREDQQPPAPQEQGQQQPEADAGEPAAEAGEKKDGEMSRQEAAALLDAQRGQEVSPEEVTKRLQGAVVGEPAEDW